MPASGSKVARPAIFAKLFPEGNHPLVLMLVIDLAAFRARAGGRTVGASQFRLDPVFASRINSLMNASLYPVSVRLACLCLLSLSAFQTADAGSATWGLHPTNDDWNTAANWMPATVPNGTSDVANFDVSDVLTPTVSADTTVDSIVFTPAAPAYALTVSPPAILTTSGSGVINNSGVEQTFNIPAMDSSDVGRMFFYNEASAGDGNTYNVDGLLWFDDNSTAGTNTFVETGYPAALIFEANASFGHGHFILQAGTSENPFGAELQITSSGGGDATFTLGGALAPDVDGGDLFVTGTSDRATIDLGGGVRTDEPGSVLVYTENGSSGDSIITAHGGLNGGMGGQVRFYRGAGRNDNSRIILRGNATVDIRAQKLKTGVKIGSLEGHGTVFLGDKVLTVGGNNLDTNFGGILSGSATTPQLTKIGGGQFVLSGPNTFSGGVTVSSGSLLVTNGTGSATGTGPVLVNSGAFGGYGTVAGAVTVGTGAGTGASLAPSAGTRRFTTLTLQNTLELESDAQYLCNFKVQGNVLRSDEVVAKGVTINGATIALHKASQGTAAPGTSVTLISNTASTPISGTFANLADGSTFLAGENNLRVSYEGGDGNDLTLTVLP
jgi:autotransporter-associated beta strand protein